MAIALAFAHGANRLTSADLKLLNHRMNFLCRYLSAVGKTAYFIRHHSETATCLTRPRGLDSGIER
ncbi:hypothetical protein D3C72_2362400 [compost metagenome]